ncbi:MAG: hypothetical protein CR972_04860 [Candidatus Moraniibacteriota bacterium]|nr:MAG: hypothetical protein CR972_04860 [Candidatus Moranbacteria bacterium]
MTKILKNNKEGNMKCNFGAVNDLKKEVYGVISTHHHSKDALLPLNTPGFFVTHKDSPQNFQDKIVIDHCLVNKEEYFILQDIG